MKNVRVFLSENFQFLEVDFSIYFNRRVFVMYSSDCTVWTRNLRVAEWLHVAFPNSDHEVPGLPRGAIQTKTGTELHL